MSNVEQGSLAWIAERLGKITASRIDDVLAKPRKGNGTSSTRDNYKAQLALERITGKMREEFQTRWMERGIEMEPLARVAYEDLRGVEVDAVGFIPHPSIANAGCSPDGFIGNEGQIQIKCPNAATHFKWLQSGGLPAEHRKQMAFELACTGRQWSDFVSYHPEMPDHLKVFVSRFNREAVYIAEIEQEVMRFDAEIQEMIRHLPSGKSQEELLQASIEAAPRKSKIHEAVSRAKEDPTTITQEDVEFAKGNV